MKLNEKPELCEGLPPARTKPLRRGDGPTPHLVRPKVSSARFTMETVRSSLAARSRDRCRTGFTLIELLASMAILGLIMVVLFSAFDQVNKAWLQGESRVETFTQARAALDFMAKELSQAVVTPNITFLGNANNLAFVAPVNDAASAVDLVEVVYRPSWRGSQSGAAVDPANICTTPMNTWPAKLVRRTSHFDAVAGAPLHPLGPGEGWDYGIGQPCLVNKPWDFYPVAPGVIPNPDWPETSAFERTAVLAENVVSLTFDYYDVNGIVMNPAYWNSNRTLPAASWSHELPPATAIRAGVPVVMINRAPAGVQITIGLIDTRTAAKLNALTPAIINQATRSFTTYVAIPNRQP